MRWVILLIAIAVSLAVSLLLSAITHTFIFLAFLPFLFVPVVFSCRSSG